MQSIGYNGLGILFNVDSSVTQLGRAGLFLTIVCNNDNKWELRATDRKVQTLSEVVGLLNFAAPHDLYVHFQCGPAEGINVMLLRKDRIFSLLNNKVCEVYNRDSLVLRVWKALTNQSSRRVFACPVNIDYILKQESSYLPALSLRVRNLIIYKYVERNDFFAGKARLEALESLIFAIIEMIPLFFYRIKELYDDADKYKCNNRIVKYIDLTMAAIAGTIFDILNCVKYLAAAIIHPAIVYRSIEGPLRKAQVN